MESVFQEGERKGHVGKLVEEFAETALRRRRERLLRRLRRAVDAARAGLPVRRAGIAAVFRTDELDAIQSGAEAIQFFFDFRGRRASHGSAKTRERTEVVE